MKDNDEIYERDGLSLVRWKMG